MDQEVKEKYRLAGSIGRKGLEFGKSLVEPDALLLDIANGIEKHIVDLGGKPSFPVNISINNEAAHYSPFHGDKKRLRTGDVVKLDVGAQVDGYLSDNAATIEVGGKGEYSTLIDATREALNSAIRRLRPMIEVRQIGEEIESTIRKFGFKPIRNLGGHGINRYDLHSEIFIPNYDDGNSKTLHNDMVIAIEPFASTGIGMIHNGPGGNIYILSGTKIRQDEILYKNFNTVPFAQRWVAELMPDADDYIRKMMKSREVSEFAVLKEHKGTMISQAEHTIMILSDEVIVTTA